MEGMFRTLLGQAAGGRALLAAASLGSNEALATSGESFEPFERERVW